MYSFHQFGAIISCISVTETASSIDSATVSFKTLHPFITNHSEMYKKVYSMYKNIQYYWIESQQWHLCSFSPSTEALRWFVYVTNTCTTAALTRMERQTQTISVVRKLSQRCEWWSWLCCEVTVQNTVRIKHKFLQWPLECIHQMQ